MAVCFCRINLLSEETMETRRDFIKKASLLGGATALINFLPESLQRAMAINAPAGSTYLDAEHVVFLMQENRSFDHCFGTMKGVRGYNDPRAMQLTSGLPVWFQKDAAGNSYGPYRLDIENSRATWMGSLPHSWKDMVEARNNGKMDRWLDAKRPGNKDYAHLPLTMGYYAREDIPFYYALGDAFTVCDQHFCSSLTGTSPNRSYFWSGTVRERPRDGNSSAHVDNGQLVYKNVGWKTYPERLQEAGIPWKVYQNELSIPVGYDGEHDDWLGNFTNNNLEFHAVYGVRFHPTRRSYREKRIAELSVLLAGNDLSRGEREELTRELDDLKTEHAQFSQENFDKLSEQRQEVHRRGLLTNTGDVGYHDLETILTDEPGSDRPTRVPKGDIFHQFRADVNEGNLPTVSWLVAPGSFSDHPGYPWYGAWYVSEALDILTKNPDVWKKTIFIINYDENDGYYDHISPFVPPLTSRPESGKVASGIDTQDEYVTAEQEKLRTGDKQAALDSPIGLGYRVPLVIASPWSKGGWVNSEVFDLTSPLQFLEHFLEHKTGKKIIEDNLSDWRRLVCGNLTSVFRPASEQRAPALEAVDRNSYVKRINSSRNKDIPGNHHLIGAEELEKIKSSDSKQYGLGLQEKGTKPACAVPYGLEVNLSMQGDNVALVFKLNAKGQGTKAIGVPFIVISRSPYGPEREVGRSWNFAVRQDEPLEYLWPTEAFTSGDFHLEVYGPNGFFRSFKGSRAAVALGGVEVAQVGDLGKRELLITAGREVKGSFKVRPLFYKTAKESYELQGSLDKQRVSFNDSFGWYDIEIFSDQDPTFYQRHAGHIENGAASQSDPLMGGVL